MLFINRFINELLTASIITFRRTAKVTLKTVTPLKIPLAEI